MRVLSPHLIWSAITLLCACGAPPGPAPVVDPVSETEPIEEGPTSGCSLQSQAIYSGQVATDSLHTQSLGEFSFFAAESTDGEVLVGGLNLEVESPARGQLGCLGIDAAGNPQVVVLERDLANPLVKAVLYQRLDDQWTAQDLPGDLIIEPGSHCAFITQEEGSGVLLRGRRDPASSPYDLWLIQANGQAEALNLGEHVPSIVASRQSDDGALVVLKEVFRQGETRSYQYQVWRLNDAGYTPLESEYAPPSAPAGLGTESRTAILLRIEAGRMDSPDLLGRAHATLESRSLSLNAQGNLAAPIRVDFTFPISRELRPRGLFADGRWWAILSSEAYLQRSQSEPEPYRELLVPIEEGRPVLRWLPEGLGNVQALGVDQVIGVVLDADNPELGSGIELIQAPQCAEPL